MEDSCEYAHHGAMTPAPSTERHRHAEAHGEEHPAPSCGHVDRRGPVAVEDRQLHWVEGRRAHRREDGYDGNGARSRDKGNGKEPGPPPTSQEQPATKSRRRPAGADVVRM